MNRNTYLITKGQLEAYIPDHGKTKNKHLLMMPGALIPKTRLNRSKKWEHKATYHEARKASPKPWEPVI
jgi:hypothetical protein